MIIYDKLPINWREVGDHLIGNAYDSECFEYIITQTGARSVTLDVLFVHEHGQAITKSETLEDTERAKIRAQYLHDMRPPYVERPE